MSFSVYASLFLCFYFGGVFGVSYWWRFFGGVFGGREMYVFYSLINKKWINYKGPIWGENISFLVNNKNRFLSSLHDVEILMNQEKYDNLLSSKRIKWRMVVIIYNLEPQSFWAIRNFLNRKRRVFLNRHFHTFLSDGTHFLKWNFTCTSIYKTEKSYKIFPPGF